MNKKGFTLVELLAVIIIVAIVSTLAVTSLISLRGNINDTSVTKALDLIIESAKEYADDHASDIAPVNEITVKDLSKITDLSVDSKYDNLLVQYYIYNNQGYACLVDKTDNYNLLGIDSNEKLEVYVSYFCEKSATFAKGVTVRDAIETMANTYLSGVSSFQLKHCESSPENCGQFDKKVSISSVSSKLPVYLFPGNDGNLYYYTQSGHIFLNKDSSYMFAIPKLSAIEGIKDCFNSGYVTDMSHMFEGASNITSLDLSGWFTENVTNMSSMFKNASSLSSLTIRNNHWNTSKVTDMSYMFYNNKELTSTAFLSTFDTSNVTDMSHMFSGCSNVTSLENLKYWDVRKVESIIGMFENMSSLENIDALGDNEIDDDNNGWIHLAELSGSVKIGGLFKKDTSINRGNSITPLKKWGGENGVASRITEFSSYYNGKYNGAFQQTRVGYNAAKAAFESWVINVMEISDVNNPCITVKSYGQTYKVPAQFVYAFPNGMYSTGAAPRAVTLQLHYKSPIYSYDILDNSTIQGENYEVNNASLYIKLNRNTSLCQ